MISFADWVLMIFSKNALLNHILLLSGVFGFLNLNGLADLKLIGFIDVRDGIGQVLPNIAELVEKRVDLSCKLLENRDLRDISSSLRNKLEKGLLIDRGSRVSIFCHLPDCFMKHQDNSLIRYAYSFVETDAVPEQWVSIFNEHFDGILVADDAMVDIYKKSGVKKPVFCLPLPLRLQRFFSVGKQLQKNDVFTFGCSAGFWERKNQELLIDAFLKIFGANRSVKLILHGRAGDLFDRLKSKIICAGVSNIQIVKQVFDEDQYLRFMASLDCYVLLSKGEGFSITPRQAMALGVPCILSNVLAHKTICASGLVCGVNALYREPGYHDHFGRAIGFYYTCDLDDVCRALLDVYTNYNVYKNKAIAGCYWVRQYDCCDDILRSRYCTLVKPKKVLYGVLNQIREDGVLVTTSKTLVEKYEIFGEKV